MVATEPDGDVIVDEMDGSEGDTPADTSDANACNDSEYNLYFEKHPDGDHKIKWYETVVWRFNLESTPGQTTQARAESAIKQGTGNVTNAKNPCGLTDNVSADALYDGDADKNAAIGADGECLKPNGGNQVSFGQLNDPVVLAVACQWWQTSVTPHRITQADIKLDDRNNWYAPGLEECTDDWSIEAVATHERGHTFGLNHAGEALHPWLSFSAAINGKCQNSEASLGKGDVLGLRQLY